MWDGGYGMRNVEWWIWNGGYGIRDDGMKDMEWWIWEMWDGGYGMRDGGYERCGMVYIGDVGW